MNVTYDGPSDFQEFSKADFAKADVEQGKLVFARGESTEVNDEVGKALTSKEGIFGAHQFSEVKEAKEDTRTDSEREADKNAEGNTPPQENADAGVEGQVPNAPEANPQRSRR